MKTLASPASSRVSAASAHLRIAYQLDALLHTMRVLARAEEQLCSLMHGIERERTLPARARRELLHLLEDLPTDTCDADRHAILEALGSTAAPPARAATQVPARQPARTSQATRHNGAPAAGKAGRSPDRGKTSRSRATRPPASGSARQAAGGKARARKPATAKGSRATKRTRP